MIDPLLLPEFVLRDHRLSPRPIVHLHHLQNLRQPEIIRSIADEIEQFVVCQNQVRLRAF